MKNRNDREELDALNRGLNVYLAAKAGKEVPKDPDEEERRSDRMRRRGSLNTMERRGKSPLQAILTVVAVAAILVLIVAAIFFFLL